MVRVEFDGGIEVGQGLIVLLLAGMQGSPHPDGCRVAWVGADRLVQICESFLRVFLQACPERQDLAPKHEVLLAEADRLVEGFGSAFGLAAGQKVQLCDSEERLGLLRVELHSLFEILQRHPAILRPPGVQESLGENGLGISQAALDSRRGEQLACKCRVIFVEALF